jgi:phosphotransferase system  glucose/maltose/N-acetylglucosamine-specific IIC component
MLKWFMEPTFSDGVIEFFGDGIGVVLLGFLKMLIIWVGLLLIVAIICVFVLAVYLTAQKLVKQTKSRAAKEEKKGPAGVSSKNRLIKKDQSSRISGSILISFQAIPRFRIDPLPCCILPNIAQAIFS